MTLPSNPAAKASLDQGVTMLLLGYKEKHLPIEQLLERGRGLGELAGDRWASVSHGGA